MNQVKDYERLADGPGRFWVEDNGMTVHARFPKDAEPGSLFLEITAREQVFAPVKRYLNYIHVKGSGMFHAANGYRFLPRSEAYSAERPAITGSSKIVKSVTLTPSGWTWADNGGLTARGRCRGIISSGGITSITAESGDFRMAQHDQRTHARGRQPGHRLLLDADYPSL